jgi:predicted SnoaL-like aldol condensation-catalyzing enzyme
MSTEANKALVRRTLEEFYNQGDLTLADEVFAANYVNHDPAQPEVRDLAGLKRYWIAICAGFPDQQTTVEDLLADGEMVVKLRLAGDYAAARRHAGARANGSVIPTY